MFLRRWNSYTPLLTTIEQVRSTKEDVGGGFFIRWHGMGIVVDPGIDFIRNLYNTEWGAFSIADIDAIIVSHFHLDHMADVLPLLDLIYRHRREWSKANKEPVKVFLNPTTYKFMHHIGQGGKRKGERKYYEFINIQKDPTKACMNHENGLGSFEIRHVKVVHSELGVDKDDAYPLALNIMLKDGAEGGVNIAFSGDTGWPKDSEDQDKLVNFLAEADTVVLNVGKLHTGDTTEGENYPKHLSGKGVWTICSRLNDKWSKDICHDTGIPKQRIIVISEFGLEFKEYRAVFAHLLDSYLDMVTLKRNGDQRQDNWLKVYPADLDLAVRFEEREGEFKYQSKALCPMCRDGGEAIDKIREIKDFYDEGERIVYVCLDPHIA